ncbi:DUF3857 domain-containing protein [Flavobacterium sp. LB1P62]|uniref:DUF3857 domain-containing protein n=1 Tax=Flavobacterium sp. LB1P62 TaxID=3401715 RepID=UPI003AAF0B31
MKLYSAKVALFLLLMVSVVKAQELKLVKVTIAELEEKQYSKDTVAVAAILYKKGRTFFTYNVKTGFAANHEFTFRIKIYKKEGLHWADFEVPYYIGYEKLKEDYLTFNDAVTYNLEGGTIVKTKLNNEGSFKTKVNENWKKASISLPNVKAGSIIEFSYLLKSENIVKFPVYDIQYTIPVKYSEYRTEVPEYYIYKTLLKGYVDVQSESKYENGSVNYNNEYNQSNTMRYKQINNSYIAKDVPAIKEEEYVDNLKNYKASIHNELERTRFPESPVKDYTITWEGVAKTIFESKDFGEQLKVSSFLINDLGLILKDIDSKEERLKVIFKFVQEKMNWNNEYGYYTDKGVLKAYADRTGNVAEINFILISMLRLAGISADPVLISTIEHGVPVFPSRTDFNYVVAMAEIDDKQILLDATHNYTTQNILPLNALNWKGRLIKQDGTSNEINLVPTVPSVVNYNLSAKVYASGEISGEIKSRKSNYEAYRFRDKYAGMNSDSYIEKLEHSYNGIEISKYTIVNKNTDLLKPVDESFAFKSTNQSEIIGEEIFLNPLLFFTLHKNPFVQDKRKMPIYFGYPIQNRYNISIEIPEGYQVESLPKGINLSMGDGSFSFKYFLEKKENRIQIVVQSETKNAVVSAEDYLMLKDFYQQIMYKQKEKIVLKKI